MAILDRSKQPIDVSVLLATRGRTDALQRSLNSLVDNAHDISRIEILLAFDHDDQDSYNWFQQHIVPDLENLGAAYTAFGFDRLGYIRLNEYINYLASKARGKWFLFWGDDAIMETLSWDQEIMRCEDFRVQRMPTHNLHPYAIFPIVPRAWFDVFGYFSPHQLNDSWVSHVAYLMDIMHTIPVSVTHDRFDITGNNNDATYQNRPMLEGNPSDPRDFNHVSWRRRREQDCNRLCKYLQDTGQDTTWWQAVKAGTQNPFEKMCSPEYDPNQQVTRIT